MFAEIDPAARRRPRHRGRRLDDDRHRAGGDRGAGAGDRADAAAADRRPARASGRRCRGTGDTPAPARATSPTTWRGISGEPNVSIQETKAFTCDVRAGRRQGTSTRKLAGAAPARAPVAPGRGRPAGREPQGGGGVSTRRPPPRSPSTRWARSGWASSPTPRCASAARPARSPASSGTTCPPTASRSPRAAPMTTPASCRRAPGATSASSSCSSPPPQLRAEASRRWPAAPAARSRRSRRGRAGRLRPRVPTCDGHERVADAGQDGRLVVHVRRVQALHERRLPGCLPDRRADPHRARDRRAAARRVQRLRLLRAGVPVRGRRPGPDRRPGRASARSVTTG